MLFRKNKPEPPATPPKEQAEEPDAVQSVPPPVMELLQRLEKAGVQLLVRRGGREDYTTEVVGLGTDAFFIDTLTPPEGDTRMQPGTEAQVETLFHGMSYSWRSQVLGRVQFVDELPAFKLSYPQEIHGERRRKSPRVDTRGDASLSFLKPFACDAPVVNLSEGGLAFEYAADLGRLGTGTVIRDVLLELGEHPVIRIQCRVVGNLVIELGGISLPRRYRSSVAFQGLSASEQELIRTYLEELKTVDVSV